MTLEQLLEWEKETDRVYQKLKTQGKLTDDIKVYFHISMNRITEAIKEFKKQTIY